MVTFGVHQLLSNSALYEHICLGKIKKLYKSTGKCDGQHQYKSIIGSAMISTPEVLTENSPLSVGTSGTMKKLSTKIC